MKLSLSEAEVYDRISRKKLRISEKNAQKTFKF